MNRVLTEEYIKSKTKKDKLENIRTLNLKQCNIENITILSSLCNIKILCLNDNYIKTLSPFNKTTNIEELYIRNNLIEQMKEIDNLKNCKRLRVLCIKENPIENIDDYQYTIIDKLPQLDVLDDISISSEGKENIFKDGLNVPSNIVRSVMLLMEDLDNSQVNFIRNVVNRKISELKEK